ncbi:hypothetical protein GQ600_7596 [Phytophthora cactorum]|nr:hypothetical protein GQ600_7596 [Phytophthora cactorum]
MLKPWTLLRLDWLLTPDALLQLLILWPLELYEAVAIFLFWRAMQDHYAFLEPRRVDWQLVRQLFGDTIQPATSDDDLWIALQERFVEFPLPRVDALMPSWTRGSPATKMTGAGAGAGQTLLDVDGKPGEGRGGSLAVAPLLWRLSRRGVDGRFVLCQREQGGAGFFDGREIARCDVEILQEEEVLHPLHVALHPLPGPVGGAPEPIYSRRIFSADNELFEGVGIPPTEEVFPAQMTNGNSPKEQRTTTAAASSAAFDPCVRKAIDHIMGVETALDK